MLGYHHSLHTTIPSVGIYNPNKEREAIEYETDRADNERKEDGMESWAVQYGSYPRTYSPSPMPISP